MSTNLKIANVDEAGLAYKIINDITLGDGATPTPIVDVTQEAGSLYYLSLDASASTIAASAATQYLKLYLTTSEVTIITTTPDVVLLIPAATRFKMSCPLGLPFTSFSASLLTAGANAGSANTEAGSNRFSILNVVTS
tara:strand:- start:1522 stop:1935 length:414 start_codon:yes stop_codon:yes gene_type:complete